MNNGSQKVRQSNKFKGIVLQKFEEKMQKLTSAETPASNQTGTYCHHPQRSSRSVTCTPPSAEIRCYTSLIMTKLNDVMHAEYEIIIIHENVVKKWVKAQMEQSNKSILDRNYSQNIYTCSIYQVKHLKSK